MEKRPGLGKRKRVTQPQSKAADKPYSQMNCLTHKHFTPGIQPPRTLSQRTQRVWRRPPKTASPMGFQEEEAGEDDRCPGGRDG